MRGVGLFLNVGDVPPPKKTGFFSRKKSQFGSGRKPRSEASDSFFKLAPHGKDIIVVFRWLVILVLACFAFFSPETYSPGRFALILGLIFVYCLSNLILSFMKEAAFRKMRIGGALFLADILLIAAIMYFIRGFETDLYLVFFLIIFVAAMQHGGMRRCWITGLVTAALYVGLYRRNNYLDSLLDS